jgi:hypothetical protein
LNINCKVFLINLFAAWVCEWSLSSLEAVVTVFPPISLRIEDNMSQAVDLAFIMSVLRAANQSGVLNMALQNLSQEPSGGSAESDQSWAVVTNGVMTDGSKRRLPSPTPSDDTALEPKEIRSLPHDLWTRLESRAMGNLPSKVPSMKVWSQTLISFGKFEKEKISYFDLVTDTDVNKTGYVKWVLSHTSEKSTAQLKDLRDFIKIYHLEVHGVDSGVSHFADGKIREFKK